MSQSRRVPAVDRLEEVVGSIVDDVGRSEDRGKTTDFLPELSQIDTHQFGMAILTRKGDIVAGGDADTQFSIQSISKVFSLHIALEAYGADLWKRVGREPSGDPYNSIVDLERHKGYPRNPFINAGALVVMDTLLSRHDRGGLPDPVRDLMAELIDEDGIGVDEDVANSEESSGFTNRALANLAKSFGNFENDVEAVLKIYVRQCAIALSCRQLAQAGRIFMLDGFDEASHLSHNQARRARRINSLMLTCGQYDGSGDFAFRVGLPAKSGIGGGILAIVPNVATVAVWSPGLDENGNSMLGTKALELLSDRLDWSVFGAAGERYD